MRGKFITNAILSLIVLIGWIVLIVAIKDAIDGVDDNGVSGHYEYNSYGTRYWVDGDLNDETWDDIKVGALSYVAIIIGGIASFVMGIVTLATYKPDHVRGLAITSGVLGIFGGLFGINIIISIIGAVKAGNSQTNQYNDRSGSLNRSADSFDDNDFQF